jgi:uncharacterized protein YecE (DUF72 family)
MLNQPRAYIGTSGWQYNHWKDGWYKGVKKKDWLPFMTTKLNAVEANGTFYRLPKRETFESWKAITPQDFRFTIKAHRFLTHRKRLKEISDGITREKEAAGGLGEKLAVVVWQLPSNLQANQERLESFLQELKAWEETRHSIEFRHNSWFTDETAKKLEEARVAVCISDASKWPMWEAATTDLVYLRLHGHEYTYWSAYTDEQLESWAAKCRAWLKEGREVHAYFDNDAQGAAPYDAEKLAKLVSNS